MAAKFDLKSEALAVTYFTVDEIHIIQSRLRGTELVTQAHLFVGTVAMLRAVTTTNMSVPVLIQSKSQTSLACQINNVISFSLNTLSRWISDSINELNTNNTMEDRRMLFLY